LSENGWASETGKVVLSGEEKKGGSDEEIVKEMESIGEVERHD